MSYSDPTTLDTYPLAEECILYEGSAAFYGADTGTLAIFMHERPDLWEPSCEEDDDWAFKKGFLNELRRYTDFDAKIKKIIELSVDPDREIVFDDFLTEIEGVISDQGWTYTSYECTDDPHWMIAVFVDEVAGDFEFTIEFIESNPWEDVPIEEHKIKVTSGVVSWGLK